MAGAGSVSTVTVRAGTGSQTEAQSPPTAPPVVTHRPKVRHAPGKSRGEDAGDLERHRSCREWPDHVVEGNHYLPDDSSKREYVVPSKALSIRPVAAGSGRVPLLGMHPGKMTDALCELDA